MEQRLPILVYCPCCDEQHDADAAALARRGTWYAHTCRACGTRFNVLRADLLAYAKRAAATV